MGYYGTLLFGLMLPIIVAGCYVCCCRRRGLKKTTPADMGTRLRTHHENARERKFRLTVAIFQIGWILIGFVVPVFWYLILGVIHQGGRPMLNGCWPGISLSGALYLLGLLPIGVNTILLVVGPADKTALMVLLILATIALGLLVLGFGFILLVVSISFLMYRLFRVLQYSCPSCPAHNHYHHIFHHAHARPVQLLRAFAMGAAHPSQSSLAHGPLRLGRRRMQFRDPDHCDVGNERADDSV